MPIELRGNYLSILKSVHRERVPRTYVEIGLFTGDSFSLARRQTLAVGIDPAPRFRHRLPKRAKVYETTSDEFFADHDLRKLLGGPVDVAFIDGMHHFEFALRDFRNLERHAASASVILVHDCYPPSPEWTSREPRPGPWAGDVWRLLACLEKYRPDLRVVLAPASPSGLGIVGGLDPDNRELFERYDEIVEETMSLAFTDYEPSNVVPPNWSSAAHLFPGPYRRRGVLEGTSYRVRRLSRRTPARSLVKWARR